MPRWKPVRGQRAVSGRATSIPKFLLDKCLNCLSSAHRVATCKLPQRCLRCRGLRHIAHDCKQPRKGAFQRSGNRALSHPGEHATLRPEEATSGLGGSRGPGGDSAGVDVPSGSRRQRRRRRRRRRHQRLVGRSWDAERAPPAALADLAVTTSVSGAPQLDMLPLWWCSEATQQLDMLPLWWCSEAT